MRRGSDRYSYPLHPAWKYNDYIHKPHVFQYPGERLLHFIEKQKWHGTKEHQDRSLHFITLIRQFMVIRQR